MEKYPTKTGILALWKMTRASSSSEYVPQDYQDFLICILQNIHYPNFTY